MIYDLIFLRRVHETIQGTNFDTIASQDLKDWFLYIDAVAEEYIHELEQRTNEGDDVENQSTIQGEILSDLIFQNSGDEDFSHELMEKLMELVEMREKTVKIIYDGRPKIIYFDDPLEELSRIKACTWGSLY